MVYFKTSPNGKLLHEIWIKASYAAMVHDCEVIPNDITRPNIPLRTLMSLHGSWFATEQKMSQYSQQCRLS